MSASERVYYHSLLTKNRLWTPLPGPQTRAYWCEADELFYGGQAGGGKTDLLVGLGVSSHKSSIIFRREFKQLGGAEGVIERSRTLLGRTKARYNGQSLMWRDIPGSRRLQFGAVQHEKDKESYQGHAHDLKGFDEITHFTKTQYEYLIGWNRTTDPEQRCRVVCAGNPPLTPEGQWVIEAWAPWLDTKFENPAEPGELRWYVRVGGDLVWVDGSEPVWDEAESDWVQPKSRTFIPASVEDNPYLLETGYKTTLYALPEPLRSAFAHGDFGIQLQDDPWQVIPTAWVMAAQARWKMRERPDTPLTALGVDVARGGADQTVLAKRYGNWVAPLDKHPGKDTPNGQAVARLVIEAKGSSSVVPAIDVIGVGASVYDLLIAQNISALPVNFAEGSKLLDKSGNLGFVNKRAEYYWRMREALDPETGDDLALPDDRELLADLCAVRWRMTTSGIKCESKDEIKKRLNRSPDCADAVVMAVHQGATFSWEFV